METQVVTSLISGVFSLATAVVSVWLKQYLEEHRRTVAVAKPGQAARVEGVEVRGAPRIWNVSRAFLVCLGGFIVGIVTSAVRESMRLKFETFLSVIVLSGFCLALALNNRKSQRGFWPYQLEVLALWAAYTSGWLLVHGRIWSDLIGFTFLFWMGSAFVGGFIVIASRQKDS